MTNKTLSRLNSLENLLDTMERLNDSRLSAIDKQIKTRDKIERTFSRVIVPAICVFYIAIAALVVVLIVREL